MFERRDTPALIGVVHLLPLPGGPAPSPGLLEVLRRARMDAAALAEGGADALIVENLGDAPFAAEQVEPYTVAAMTLAALEAREAAGGLPLGLNVLRNDARAALGIAAATGGRFVRVNVHVGCMVTDQGLLTGRARDTLLERRRLGAEVAVAADVQVKHAAPLAPRPLAELARDTRLRGQADALIVTGPATGAALDLADLQEVRAALDTTPLWAGSGVQPEQAAALRGLADAVVVGTWLHEDADLSRPLDPRRVARMRAALVG